MKILSPRAHGVIDYAIVILLAVAPTLFGFYGTPRTICYVLAAAHLAMTLLTAYPLGAAKLIPFTVHGGIEVAIAVALVLIPWVFRFSTVIPARNFFLASAGLVAIVWLLTDYRAAGYPYLRGPKRPSPA